MFCVSIISECRMVFEYVELTKIKIKIKINKLRRNYFVEFAFALCPNVRRRKFAEKYKKEKIGKGAKTKIESNKNFMIPFRIHIWTETATTLFE